jgi:hypothetical protein
MHLAPHLPLELGDVARVVGIPQRQRYLTGVSARIGIVLCSTPSSPLSVSVIGKKW